MVHTLPTVLVLDDDSESALLVQYAIRRSGKAVQVSVVDGDASFIDMHAACQAADVIVAPLKMVEMIERLQRLGLPATSRVVLFGVSSTEALVQRAEKSGMRFVDMSDSFAAFVLQLGSELAKHLSGVGDVPTPSGA